MSYGQSAIEYLMTYGWMLLVVAIVGGAVFSIVGDQSIESVSGFTGSDISITNFGLGGNQALIFNLQNTASDIIQIEHINVTDETGMNSSFDYGDVSGVPVGGEKVLGVPGIQSSDSVNRLDVSVSYSMGGLVNLQQSGTVTGNLRTENLTQNRLKYRWYDTSGHYSDNDHPSNESEMSKFFNETISGVEFRGEALWGEDDKNGINWHDGGKLPDSKPSYLPSGSYSWRVEGYIFVPESGEYLIGVDSDDASDMFIDGQKTVKWYGSHGTSGNGDPNYDHNSAVTLGAGLHSFRVRMEEGGGGDGIAVGWQKPGESSIETIPSKYYYITDE